MGGAAGCEPCLWGRRWSSLWGTIRVRGESKYAGDTMRILPLGPYVELFVGHDPCEDVSKWAERRHANCDSGTIRGAPWRARSL